MGEVVYRPRVRVIRNRGRLRTAEMPAGERVRFGVHSEVAAHYGADPDDEEPVSTTLDYVVAAACG
jgi:hypothetical protein